MSRSSHTRYAHWLIDTCTNNYVQDPSFNSVEEHPLTPDEFENFIQQKVLPSPLELRRR